MIRKTVWIVGLLTTVMVAALLLSAASPGSSAKAPHLQARMKVDNFSFGPASLTVAVGTTVTWTNRDDIPHTCEHGQSIQSKVLEPMKSSRLPSTKPDVIRTFAPSTPR